MPGYDWDVGFGFGRRYEAHAQPYDAALRQVDSAHTGLGRLEQRGYGRDYRAGTRQLERPPDYDAAFRSRGYGRGAWRGDFPEPRAGGWGMRGRFAGRGGYDRGIYGEEYPGFRGVPAPGGRGRSRGGYGREVELGGGWGRPGADYPPMRLRGDAPRWGFRRGYDAQVQQPFMPEAAYRRHPEMGYAGHHGPDRWTEFDHGRERSLALDDDEIRQAVRQGLYQDDWVDADAVEVEVSQGVVTLRGEVEDFLQARYAWDDAWETEGVRGVLNQLTVRTDRPANGEE